MTEYLSDKEQVEMLKKWWNNYGKALLIAVILGVALGFGWKYWRAHEQTRTATASLLYQTMVMDDLSHHTRAVDQAAQQLISNYKHTPYAVMARFMLAKRDVDANHYEQALTQLDWVIKHVRITSFQQVAAIRAAQILLEQKKYASAHNMLKTIHAKAYTPMIQQLQGDIYREQGQFKKAQRAYQQALKGLVGTGMKDPLLQMNIEQLSVRKDAS